MGGDHHGHGHGKDPYVIPDYRDFKVENVPELLEVQEALARKGLRDPWLRNEVWRYNPDTFGTYRQNVRNFFFRGLGIGAAAAVLTVLATNLLYKDDHGHGHDGNGHGHGENGHGGGDH